jgi:hypothetical protein
MKTDEIPKDIEAAEVQIKLILSGKLKNHMVIDPDYLAPTIKAQAGNKELALDAKEGMLRYYQSIRDALEIALSGRKIPASMMPLRAPAYLSEFKEE